MKAALLSFCLLNGEKRIVPVLADRGRRTGLCDSGNPRYLCGEKLSRFVIIGADDAMRDLRVIREEACESHQRRAAQREPPAVESRDMPLQAKRLMGKSVHGALEYGDGCALRVIGRYQEAELLIAAGSVAFEIAECATSRPTNTQLWYLALSYICPRSMQVKISGLAIPRLCR